MRLAHLTDLHFGAEVPEVVAALRDDLAGRDLDHVLVSGDLTMRARAGQFRAARELLESIGHPWTSVPGNHDLPLFRVLTRAFRPLSAYRKGVGRRAEPELGSGGLQVLGLSSPKRYLSRNGRIDAAQVARIGTAFTGPAGLRVLMLHHPVFRPAQRPGQPLVRGAEQALRAAARAGVDVILCGHDHVQAQADLALTWPGLGRHMIAVASGTACSRRTRAGESQSYTLLELTGDTLSVHVRHWNDGRFETLSETTWQRGADGWLPARAACRS
ncbi:metallophosphoesterase family protein [Actinoplanes friuliensis]|jgi:3',5'-cyclic AMP phosphodiesterase CpdA|uniref:3',5'-cyclic-nucleotide phosphodiesterase n=1 Tax=Actinoplanes friuliensis DSM 7358 TaxID=1246995 RepID=U5W109_9ACTN|nr:metallophosphoesterase [Actinoplanes friuliensis]AGZ41576.1 3',5'-cyclic-nucleotide phosphodiesterase [Actinoplanes friuliensis DSM 7358]